MLPKRPRVLTNINQTLKRFNDSNELNNFIVHFIPKYIFNKYVCVLASTSHQHNLVRKKEYTDVITNYHLDGCFPYLGLEECPVGFLITSFPTPTKFKGYKHFKLGDIILTPNVYHKCTKMSMDRRCARVLFFKPTATNVDKHLYRIPFK